MPEYKRDSYAPWYEMRTAPASTPCFSAILTIFSSFRLQKPSHDPKSSAAALWVALEEETTHIGLSLEPSGE